jgi:hypothetical protein
MSVERVGRETLRHGKDAFHFTPKYASWLNRAELEFSCWFASVSIQAQIRDAKRQSPQLNEV